MTATPAAPATMPRPVADPTFEPPPPPARHEAPSAITRALGAAPLAIALATVLVHVVVNATTSFGVHRDELLYLAMGRHLQLWRMDFPPAIALVAEATTATLGGSLWALRLPSALAGGAIVLLAAWIAGALGATRGMRALAAFAVACGPVYLGAANLFQPVVFDQLWWTAALAALVRMRRDGDPRGWLLVGAALGLGLLTKFSVAFIGAGVLVAVVVGAHRGELATRWPWLGALVALVIGSPTVVGQVRLGWPVLGQMGALQESQLARLSALDFAAGQPLLVGPGIVLGVVGAAWLLAGAERHRLRELAIAPLAALVLLALAHGKPYYGAPAWPALVAAGAAALARWRPVAARRAVAGTVAVASAAVACAAAPIAMPMLSPEGTSAWARRLGIDAATTTNMGERLALPQDFADMLGWEELVATTARVVATLTPEERATVVIVGDNYGQAGALELYGARWTLPPVVSPAGSYWFFGPGTRPGDPVIVVGEEPEDPAPYFASCTLAARTSNPWGVPEERAVPITLCRGARTTLQAIWPSLSGQQ